MINGEETFPQFKERLTGVLAIVISDGLTMRDGELKFGLSQDMPKAIQALKSITNEKDVVRMRDSNDSFLNIALSFVNTYTNSQMKPEKIVSLDGY